ncbi:hypothetical protein OY671_007431, partial [Metschnikowia pulcherrima]
DVDDDGQDDIEATPSMDDFMDQVLLLNHKRQSPWTERDAPSCATFVASQVVSQQVMQPSAFTATFGKLIPEKIKLEKAYEFPSIYLEFRQKFASCSQLHKQYCMRTLDGFKKCFEGTSDEINKVVIWMNSEFDRAFRYCLDETDLSLMEIANTRTLSREVVERKFFPKLVQSAEPVYAFVRESELTVKALNGDVAPLVNFYKSWKISDNDIWMRLCPLLVRQCQTHENLMTFQEELKKHMGRTGKIVGDTQSFVTSITRKKIFSKKSGNSSKQSESDAAIPAKSTSSSTNEATATSGLTNSTERKLADTRSRRNGKPWLPRAEYVKKKQAEREMQMKGQKDSQQKKDE